MDGNKNDNDDKNNQDGGDDSKETPFVPTPRTSTAGDSADPLQQQQQRQATGDNEGSTCASTSTTSANGTGRIDNIAKHKGAMMLSLPPHPSPSATVAVNDSGGSTPSAVDTAVLSASASASATSPVVSTNEKAAMNILSSSASAVTGQIVTTLPGAYAERIVVTDDTFNIVVTPETNDDVDIEDGDVNNTSTNNDENVDGDGAGDITVAESRTTFADDDIITTPMVLEATLAPTRGASAAASAAVNDQQEQPPSLQSQQQSLAPLVEATVAPKDDDEEMGVQHGQEFVNDGSKMNTSRTLLLVAAIIVLVVIIIIIVLLTTRGNGVKIGLQSAATPSPTITSQPTTSPQPTSTPSASPTDFPTSILQTSTFEWQQLGTPNALVGVNPMENDRFGHSVAISYDGNVIIGGAPGPLLDTIILDSVSQSSTTNTGQLTTPGRVEIYKLQQTVANFDNDSVANEIIEDWVLQGNAIYGSNPGDEFGTAVAINRDGSIVAVSAIGYDLIDDIDKVQYNNVGSVRIYRWDERIQDWAQIGADIIGDHTVYNKNGNGGEVDVDVGTFSDGHLGQSLALSADGTIVAAGGSRFVKGDFESPNKYSGYVRIYKLRSYDNGINDKNGDEEVWEQLGNDIRGDLSSNDEECGFSIDLDDSGYVIVIGCPRYDNHKGRVKTYQYSIEEDEWIPIGMNSDDVLVGATPEDYFGGTIDITGDGQHMITGSGAGYVKLFQYRSGNWMQVGETYASPLPSTVFRGSVSITNENGLVWMGSLYLYLHSMLAPGFLTAFRFQPDDTDDDNGNNLTGQWVDLGQDFLTGEENGDNFGISSDLSRNGLVLVVGADGVNNNSGRIEVYQATRKAS